MQHSIIQKSQLEGALRLDAEYYQPEYLNLISNLKSQKSKILKEILREELFYGLDINQLSKDLLKKSITSEILNEPIFSFDLGEIESNKINSKYLGQKGDILFAVRGNTCGRIAILLEDQKVIIGNNIVVCRIKPLFSPFFIFTFLISEFGQLVIERIITGTAQKQITIEELKNVIIPLSTPLFEKTINDLIFKTFDYIKNGKKLYKDAEDLLLEELGLKDFEIKDDLSYIVNLSKIKSAHRADAEYFQPKYEKLISKIKTQNAKLLSDLVTMKKGIESGSEAYQDEGKLFIRVSSLSKNGIESKDQKYLNEELYQKLRKNYEPKLGEILLTKDATPGIAYVVKEPIEGIISSGILRLELKEKDIEKEYLTLCLNSIIGQMQSERDGGGSVITHWKPEQIKRILIPILPKTTQQKIAELVQKSHEARSKAKQFLEQAKQKVEELIDL